VLVVDDERAIREITRGTLESCGYRVLTAKDGTEAVALYAQHQQNIRGVITDMSMPFLNGPATIRALQKVNAAVKILAVSGLAENPGPLDAAHPGSVRFLQKPYTAEELVRTLHGMLHEPVLGQEQV